MSSFDTIADKSTPISGGSDHSQITGGAIGRAINSLRTGFFVRLRFLTFAMMMGVSVVPIVLFYNWVEQSSFDKEVSYVDENHLIIAKNLSAALSRYVSDMKIVFELAIEHRNDPDGSTAFNSALGNFNLCNIALIDKHNRMTSQIIGNSPHKNDLPDLETIDHLRELAASANGEVAISGIRNHQGKPHFFVVQQLANGLLAIAPLAPGYIIKLQKSIAFGERGHSMVVDHNGLVVAHPNAKWQEISKNASKLSVVNAMITGNTGVMQFYSPPMKADMIAGYTFVPETGWGVMVPQPLSELAARANDVQSAALLVAATGVLLAVLFSWAFSSMLARPIQAIASSAREISSGNFAAHVGRLPRFAPVEIKLLAKTFNNMVDDLQGKTDDLKSALATAEETSRERAQLLAAATKANEVKSQFVSMVSHELRTPLTSIRGSLDLMESGVLKNKPKEAQNLLRIAIKNSGRLATMINDLLDLEKLDAGKMRYKFAKLNLADLINESVEANVGYAKINDVSFKVAKTSAPIFVKGDQNRLMQVMANLLSNAAKFSSAGSKVDVSLETSGATAHIRVQDYGMGIPAEMEEQVFEKFVQVDLTDARQAEGSGLGLSIARQIVQEHGGNLSYSSEVGKGTTFLIKLPKMRTRKT